MLGAEQKPIIAKVGEEKEYSYPKRGAKGRVACNDSLHLTPALVLKDADFQILDRMWRPSRQMRIAAALFTAKRFNKFLVLHNEGMLVYNPPHLHRECGARPPSSAPAARSVGVLCEGTSMDARRSFYLNTKQDDFAELSAPSGQADPVDIPMPHRQTITCRQESGCWRAAEICFVV
jgi:hypothetical protein